MPHPLVFNVRDNVKGIYIGRSRGVSILGNPYRMPKFTREQCVSGFLDYGRKRMKEDYEFRKAIKDCWGQFLLCYCAPEACHGDSIVILSNELHADLLRANIMTTKTKVIDSFTGDYRFLSNFWFCVVKIQLGNGHECYCKSVEHAFQMLKTKDSEIQLKIHAADTPGMAKKLGQSPEKGGLIRALRPDWEEMKVKFIKALVRQKFKKSDMQDMLLATDDAELIEGNYWNDKFWGVCNGEGENHLGRILMEVRDEYQTARRIASEATVAFVAPEDQRKDSVSG